MGYRSNVRSIIYGDNDKITALLSSKQLSGEDMGLKEFDGALKRYLFETKTWDAKAKQYLPTVFGMLELEVYGWKWYDDYTCVRAWNQLLETAEEAFDLSYEFYRCGEEDGDVERRTSADDSCLLTVPTPEINLDAVPLGDSIEPIFPF
jgi:hypothetical protein